MAWKLWNVLRGNKMTKLQEYRHSFMNRHVRSRGTSAAAPFLTTTVKGPVAKPKEISQIVNGCWFGCMFECEGCGDQCDHGCSGICSKGCSTECSYCGSACSSSCSYNEY